VKRLLRDVLFATGLVVWLTGGTILALWLLHQLACLLIRDPDDGFDDEEW